MENPIPITWLNDFVFCPVSIYFHGLYGSMEKILYQGSSQIKGTIAHETIDENKYSTSSDILQGYEIYCEEYNLIGKIDLFHVSSGILTERKKKIKKIYDGYIWQIYAQYFALSEMGFKVKKLQIYSLDDNKNYDIPLPEDAQELLKKFQQCIKNINNFDIFQFEQTNYEKCSHCIYEPYCDRSKAL